MRPTRLELSGFTSFRVPTVVDFEGADYFALVGPTGSGKSTIIDAICFALYGSVPRYDRQGLVHPVITAGQLEARVRLDFSIDDVAFTATRVVRRLGKGASTKEARLERGDEVIAGTADEVSEQVGSLLGLTFEHFTKCVVLPQGEFAKFLHDKPKDRQDLLVKLLNLGLYEKMRQLANLKATASRSEVALDEQRLEQDLGFATKEALADARSRAKRLETLRKKAALAAPSIDAFNEEIKKWDAATTDAGRWVERIAGLEVPRDIGALADEIAASLKLVSEAETEVKTRSKAVSSAIEKRKKLPDRAPLMTAIAAHERRKGLMTKVDAQQTSLKRLAVKHQSATSAHDEALLAFSEAEVAQKAAEDQHRAAHLAATLTVGEPCPVCLQSVSDLPHHDPSASITKAKDSVTGSRVLVEKARAHLDAVTADFTESRAVLATLEEQFTDLELELVGHGDKKAIEKTLGQITEADEALEVTRTQEAGARDILQEAQSTLTALREQEAGARDKFESTRDGLVPLSPPAARRKDLATDWEDLISWAAKESDRLAKSQEDARKNAAKATAKRDALVAEIEKSCLDCELEIDDGAILEAVVEAHTDAVREVERITKGIDDAKKLRARLKELQIDHEVAHQLAEHLSAKAGRFENWLVNEALELLVVGATQILEQLSGGQYALAVTELGDFQVTDRHNANEQRSAKTLSGGETFLASLSLALALSDQLADLASEGAARLDAIFLDEGFGTLDSETLDTVAATIEHLAAGGRMVGIVTHVRELAERVPVRFQVKKDARTSSIERVA